LQHDVHVWQTTELALLSPSMQFNFPVLSNMFTNNYVYWHVQKTKPQLRASHTQREAGCKMPE